MKSARVTDMRRCTARAYARRRPAANRSTPVARGGGVSGRPRFRRRLREKRAPARRGVTSAQLRRGKRNPVLTPALPARYIVRMRTPDFHPTKLSNHS